VALTAKQEELCAQSRWDLSDVAHELHAAIPDSTLVMCPEPATPATSTTRADSIESRASPRH
jgi:hypothetical protein